MAFFNVELRRNEERKILSAKILSISDAPCPQRGKEIVSVPNRETISIEAAQAIINSDGELEIVENDEKKEIATIGKEMGRRIRYQEIGAQILALVTMSDDAQTLKGDKELYLDLLVGNIRKAKLALKNKVMPKHYRALCMEKLEDYDTLSKTEIKF
jgi:hypothetical protein